ncbi:hypothetical protein [Leadbettera azotonutricia]|uniref:Putative membrane protein n=1 Tax=Leadbettera azotonutricia (strain ATCC BAA-888 / DSM 13862 / ZAS-9) TaxID=545695 RepID=F5Y751_LEAAZ|nr:hypothetical protein [Leadbettera azotonutricia]AEF80309.1 putative membrane protein [Leadbettera azotonutricia ZAS-9]
MLQKLKEDIWIILASLFVFSALMVFFTVVHPIIPYDNDDWGLLCNFRHAFPDASTSSPSRIFQEIFMPFIGLISAFVVNIFVKDYLFSFAVTLAIVLAVISTVLFNVVYRLFCSLTNKKGLSILICLLMSLFYFGFFKTRYDSTYMLYSINYTCAFYYIIPNLLNSILVCLLMKYECQGTKISPDGLGYVKFGIIVAAAYFAIFSMLFSMAILAVYCGLNLILSIVVYKKQFAKKILFQIAIIVGFLVYCYFEITSQRAATDTIGTFELNENTGFLERVVIAFYTSLGLLEQINKAFLIFAMVIIFVALIIFSVNIKKDSSNKIIKPAAMCIILCPAIFLAYMLISAMAGAQFYPSYTQVMYGAFFYFFMAAGLCLAYILEKFPRLTILVPVVILIFTNEAANPYLRFQDQMSYHWNNIQLSTKKKMELTNHWIEQMKEADSQGITEITLQVPYYPDHEDDMPTGSNYWPLGFTNSLFLHHVTFYYINVKLDYVEGMLPGE